MTTPANNDRPSETPKPPFGRESFIDYKMSIPTVKEWDLAARAELAALRAKAEVYDEAMKHLSELEGQHDESCGLRWWKGYEPGKGVMLGGTFYREGEDFQCECPVGKAGRFVASEIASGRFKP